MSTVSDALDKSIRIVQFDGTDEKWFEWNGKFLALSVRKKYYDVMVKKTTVPKHDEVLDEKKDEDKAKIEARNANAVGYAELMLSCESVLMPW